MVAFYLLYRLTTKSNQQKQTFVLCIDKTQKSARANYQIYTEALHIEKIGLSGVIIDLLNQSCVQAKLPKDANVVGEISNMFSFVVFYNSSLLVIYFIKRSKRTCPRYKIVW